MIPVGSATGWLLGAAVAPSSQRKKSRRAHRAEGDGEPTALLFRLPSYKCVQRLFQPYHPYKKGQLLQNQSSDLKHGKCHQSDLNTRQVYTNNNNSRPTPTTEVSPIEIRKGGSRLLGLNPFRTAVSFWEQLRTNYSEFEWCVPKTRLEFLLTGQILPSSDEFFPHESINILVTRRCFTTTGPQHPPSKKLTHSLSFPIPLLLLLL